MSPAARPREAKHRLTLGHELALVIGLKLVALMTLYALFFSPAHRPTIDPALRIVGEASSVQR